eukprot:TRINITY_DN1190_c0_g1_i4.p1 TRINITY_DN1190_c0_g1~~TRINITY_DN1190_c0_g1_i4.p1  ORF type:complete len:369 (-),score=31.14 TRINITY_DN1190_c0_g1_i4:667-1773(-)
MSILTPKSKLFGLDPLNLEMADDEIKKAFKSGKSAKRYMDLIAKCYEGQPKAVIKKAQARFKTIDIPTFSSYWCTGGGIDAVLGVSAVVTAVFISDDARDDAVQDMEIIEHFIDQFLKIPSIVDRVWKAAGKRLRRNTTRLGLEAVKEYGLTGNVLVDACGKLLAIGSAICRACAGNDDVYNWYIEESRVWMSHTYSIREKDIKDVVLSEVLEHRYIESACHLMLAAIGACNGVSLSKNVIRNDKINKIVEYTSMHVSVINDIFSYDREIQGPGAESNLVEYYRIVVSSSHEVDDGFRLTVELLNDYMKKYIALFNEVDLNNQEIKYLVNSAARMLVGNITWSLGAERYERKEFVTKSISYDESKLSV